MLLMAGSAFSRTPNFVELQKIYKKGSNKQMDRVPEAAAESAQHYAHCALQSAAGWLSAAEAHCRRPRPPETETDAERIA